MVPAVGLELTAPYKTAINTDKLFAQKALFINVLCILHSMEINLHKSSLWYQLWYALWYGYTLYMLI